MLSRRTFLAVSLGLLFQPIDALAARKKKKAPEVKALGPRTLSREQWPPAIAPDFIAPVDKGYVLLSDQTGRMAIVDLKREEGPVVIGELGGIGKKIVDLAATAQRAYAITLIDTGNESHYELVVISILPSTDPTILTRIPISYLTEPSVVAASGDLVALAGTSARGENQVVLYSMSPRKRSDEGNGPAATLNFEFPVSRMEFNDKQLVVLHGNRQTTHLDVIGVGNPRNPERATTLKMDGNYSVLARSRDGIMVAGTNAQHHHEVKLVAVRPAPNIVATAALPFSEVLDMSAQRGQLLVLGNQDRRISLLPFTIAKNSMNAGQSVSLPSGSRGVASKARISSREREAYIASDWGGVQVLSINKQGWQYLYSHTIPRLPAAAVAVGGNRAVLAGVEMKVYDITDPSHPQMISAVEPGSAIRAVAIANNFIVALSRDALTLRKLDKPSDLVASVKLNGQALAYDQVQHKAFVAGTKKDVTVLTPVRVSGMLVAESEHELPGIFKHLSAENGIVLAAGLNNLALFRVGDTLESLGTRTFPNLAIRAVELKGDSAVITAIDSSSKGFLIVINTLNKDLTTIGSINLPQDAVALAVYAKQAVVVGRAAHGKDEASIVDLTNPTGPRVKVSFPVLEAASAVAIRDQLALVGGRGLEILSLG